MSRKQFIEDVDALMQKIAKMETEDPAVIEYNAAKEELEAGLGELRTIAAEEGNFQTTFFKIIQKHKKTIDWKGIVARLYELKRLKEKDAEWIKKDFTKESTYGEARKITTGDSETEL
jgi:SPX domain protein involved in polyphosphate accumulation